MDSVLWVEVVSFDPIAAVSEAGALLRRARCLLAYDPHRTTDARFTRDTTPARHPAVNYSKHATN